MTIDKVCEAIAAEREAQKQAESRNDADAWCGATEHMDVLLDDLCALYRQRQRLICEGAAPRVVV